MTKQELWQARVVEWHQSGQSARVFCSEKGYSLFSLKDWSSRLQQMGLVSIAPGATRTYSGRRFLVEERGISKAAGQPTAKTEEIRLAKVVREPESVSDTPILIEVGGARISVRRGFDEATLQRVVKACGGGQ